MSVKAVGDGEVKPDSEILWLLDICPHSTFCCLKHFLVLSFQNSLHVFWPPESYDSLVSKVNVNLNVVHIFALIEDLWWVYDSGDVIPCQGIGGLHAGLPEHPKCGRGGGPRGRLIHCSELPTVVLPSCFFPAFLCLCLGKCRLGYWDNHWSQTDKPSKD